MLLATRLLKSPAVCWFAALPPVNLADFLLCEMRCRHCAKSNTPLEVAELQNRALIVDKRLSNPSFFCS